MFKIKTRSVRAEFDRKYIVDGKGAPYLLEYEGDGRYLLYDMNMTVLNPIPYQSIIDGVKDYGWKIFDEKPVK